MERLVARDTQFDPQVVEMAVVVTEEVATMEATEAVVEEATLAVEEATLAVEVELAEQVERVVMVTEVRRVAVAKQQ